MTKNTCSKFAEWQEANQVRRESIISDYLLFLGKTRVRARHLTDLAQLVARHISEVENKPCNKSTLIRNPRYKAKLLSYQARRIASGTKGVSPPGVAEFTAKVRVTHAELESENLKRELERLRIYTSTLEEQLDRPQIQGRVLSPVIISDDHPNQLSNYEFEFVRTCQALMLLISHLNLIVQVDATSRRILDMSRRRDNVIVDQEVAGPFFDWLKVQGGVLK